MTNPTNLLYAKSHEWVQDMGDGSFRIGLTDYAQKELGDLVFVNLPQEGDEVEVGSAFGDVESVKAVSDVYSQSAALSAQSMKNCSIIRKTSTRMLMLHG